MVSEDGGKRLLAWGAGGILYQALFVTWIQRMQMNASPSTTLALFDERGIEEKNLWRQWRRRRRPRRGRRVRVYLGPRKLSPSSSAAPWRWTSPSLPLTAGTSRTRRLAWRRSWRSAATRRAARAKQAICMSWMNKLQAMVLIHNRADSQNAASAQSMGKIDP